MNFNGQNITHLLKKTKKDYFYCRERGHQTSTDRFTKNFFFLSLKLENVEKWSLLSPSPIRFPFGNCIAVEFVIVRVFRNVAPLWLTLSVRPYVLSFFSSFYLYNSLLEIVEALRNCSGWSLSLYLYHYNAFFKRP